MDINATLIGQMITFAVFVWITMKFVWPPLMKLMEDRRQKIADGLAAAEQGHHELELARLKSKEHINEAKAEAAHIIEQANQRAHHIIEESKVQARDEGDRIVRLAEEEIDQQYISAKDQLMSQVAQMAVAGAEKILRREVDKKLNDGLVQDMMGET